MTTLRTPQQVREGMNNKTFSVSDRTPVIVTIPISKRKQDLGVQFWTILAPIKTEQENC